MEIDYLQSTLPHLQVSTYYNTFLSIIDIRVAGIHPSNCHQPLAPHDHNCVCLSPPRYPEYYSPERFPPSVPAL